MANIFIKGNLKLDWQKISKIDPLQISIGEQEGIAAIEEILRNLAFCSLDEEFGKELVGGSSLALRIFRVCRISQLAIQYLLYEKVKYL